MWKIVRELWTEREENNGSSLFVSFQPAFIYERDLILFDLILLDDSERWLNFERLVRAFSPRNGDFS